MKMKSNGALPLEINFTRIKEAFVEALVIVSLDYSTPFYIFSFASPHIIAVVLL